MRNSERQVAMLVLENGKCPLDDWLDKIRDKPTRARIERQIDKLSRGIGDQKSLQEISELRLDFGPGYRVYYGLLNQKTFVVLLGGGDKSNQTQDIRLARQRWEEFQRSGISKAALRAWNGGVLDSAEEEKL